MSSSILKACDFCGLGRYAFNGEIAAGQLSGFRRGILALEMAGTRSARAIWCGICYVSPSFSTRGIDEPGNPLQIYTVLLRSVSTRSSFLTAVDPRLARRV